MRSNITLTQKLSRFDEQGQSIIAQRSAVSFPPEKIMSPGIRQMARRDLDEFLDTSANKALLLPEGGVEPRQINANELRSIAALVEEGSRVMDSTIFEETSHQLILLKIRRP